jgi:hypothetical protein
MSKKETTALATQENVNMTTVSCSFFKDLSADSEKYVPSVDDCNAMTATELHKNLTAALVGTIVCYAAAKNLVVSAKMRMQAGETVGGCLTFTGVGGYVDLYVRKHSQSLEAAVRASYRLLGGLGIDEKHDGTEARAAKKKAAEEKAKQIAEKKADKAARLALDEAAKKAKVLKDKTNVEVLEAALEKGKTMTQAEIEEAAQKLQRPLVKQLQAATQRIDEAAKIAKRKSKAEAATDDLVALVLKNVTSDGTASVATVKEIYSLVEKINFYLTGKVAA